VLDLHYLESPADDGHQEDWNHGRESDDAVRSDGGVLSHLCRLVSFNILHDCEESQIEVTQHVESDVNVISELGNQISNKLSEVGFFWSDHPDEENNQVDGNNDYS